MRPFSTSSAPRSIGEPLPGRSNRAPSRITAPRVGAGVEGNCADAAVASNSAQTTRRMAILETPEGLHHSRRPALAQTFKKAALRFKAVTPDQIDDFANRTDARAIVVRIEIPCVEQDRADAGGPGPHDIDVIQV